jgi:hypothetical protein
MTKDTRLYAFYKEEDITQPSDNKYFVFDEENKSISLKSEYRNGPNAF